MSEFVAEIFNHKFIIKKQHHDFLSGETKEQPEKTKNMLCQQR